MSNPLKRPGQPPEGYTPKELPAIIGMANRLRNKALRRKPEMAMEPNIVTKRFSLIGAEGKIDFNTDFSPALQALYQKLTDRLDGMRGLAQPLRMVGYWYFETPGDFNDVRYFAGVEEDAAHVPEGLAAKILPESLYAVFAEEKRGVIGGGDGAGYKWLNGSKAYDCNEAIPGDLEVYRNLTDTAPDCEAEIYIPIKKKEG